MARVYIETSFVSACVSTRIDIESAFWRRESLEWMRTQSRRHELYLSAAVIAELSHPTFARSQDALALIAEVPRVGVSPEVVGLASLLIREKVMPAPLEGDALHVAAAAFHRMDYLLTWNVKHLANPNKRIHLSRVCMRHGLTPPEIVTPINLWEFDDA